MGQSYPPSPLLQCWDWTSFSVLCSGKRLYFGDFPWLNLNIVRGGRGRGESTMQLNEWSWWKTVVSKPLKHVNQKLELFFYTAIISKNPWNCLFCPFSPLYTKGRGKCSTSATNERISFSTIYWCIPKVVKILVHDSKILRFTTPPIIMRSPLVKF